jgi:hypothetical protein
MRLALAALGTFAPALALACPVCATDQNPHLALLVGGMIAAPYLVSAAVIHAIRAGGEEP